MSGPRTVKVVLSESMWERVSGAAAQHDQTVSEFIRTAIRSQFTDQDVRAKGADHALDLIRAIATGATGSPAAAQPPLPFDPKGGE